MEGTWSPSAAESQTGSMRKPVSTKETIGVSLLLASEEKLSAISFRIDVATSALGRLRKSIGGHWECVFPRAFLGGPIATGPS
jgi:hypothetical protein